MGDKTISVEYWLTEVGRKASLLAGGDGKGTQVMRIPLTSALLAHASVGEDGIAEINLSRGTAAYTQAAYTRYDAPIEASEAAVLGAIANLTAAREAHDAEVAQRDAERKARAAESAQRAAERAAAWNARPLEDRICRDLGYWHVRGGDGDGAALAEAHAECARRDAREKADREAAQIREKADRETWIQEHGSDRLREALRLGLVECVQKSYADERLAIDRPGWRWSSEYQGEDEEHKIVEPTMAALAAFATAREVYPEVELVWLVDRHEKDCEESEAGWDCAPDCHAQKRYALALDYRDRRIVRDLEI